MADIWLGDLVRAVTALRPADDETADAIASLLGVRPSSAVRRSIDTAEAQSTDAPVDLRVQPEQGDDDDGEGSAPEVRVDQADGAPDQAAAILDVLHPVATEPVVAPPRWEAVAPLAPPRTRAPLDASIPEPLFEPRWHREIAAAAAAQLLPLGLADVRTLVRRVARSLPVTQIPRRSRWSVMQGVQVLVDNSPGMEPFRHDQGAFVRTITSVVGTERVEVVDFESAPLRGVYDPEGRLRPYRPPPPGTPVIVLSNLGQNGPVMDAGRATVGEWEQFADSVAPSAARVLTLVPYPPELIAPRLRRATGAVYWDRGTSLRHIRASGSVLTEAASSGPVTADTAVRTRAEDRAACARQLAVLASPAVFVEPELLRALRLTLLPHAGPEAESAVWFGAHVRARNPAGIVFDLRAMTAWRSALQNEWTRSPAGQRRLLTARAVMARVHRWQSAALRLEERLAWSVVTGDLDAAERELDSALKAHASGRRPGVGAWATQAWARLPEEVRNTGSGWVFYQLARTRARRPLPATEMPSQVRAEDIAAAATIVPDVKLGVLRRGDLLELGNLAGEGAVAIMVPDTEPRTLEVRSDSGAQEIQLRLRATERAELTIGHGPLTLRTARGAVYELPAVRPATVRPAEKPTPPPSSGRQDRRSWSPEWPAWELQFKADGVLVGAKTLERIAGAGLTDVFVFVHGWNVDLFEARDFYGRLTQKLHEVPGDEPARRYGVIGVLWPSKLWADPDLQPGAELDSDADAAEMATAITPEQRERLSELSQRLASEADDDAARDQVHAFEHQIEQEQHREQGKSRLGDFFQGLRSGVFNVARMTTYYAMRTRAGNIGRDGLGPALGRLGQLAPSLRVHLVAHSVGARLAAYALVRRPTNEDASSPVKSLVLLQPILARNAFSSGHPDVPGAALAPVLSNVDGPIVVTYSAQDRATGVLYEMLTRIAARDSDAPDERPGKGMGFSGARAPEAVLRHLGPVGSAYSFESRRIFNVDASEFVKDHSDVTGPEVAWLILSAAGGGSLPK